MRAKSNAPRTFSRFEAADARLDVTRIVAHRLFREDPHRAAFGVLTEQRSLRAAQNLDIADVGEVEQRAKHRTEVDVVYIEADTRLERVFEVVLADAAIDTNVDLPKPEPACSRFTFGAACATSVTFEVPAGFHLLG